MSVLDSNGQENIKNTDEQLDMTDKSIAGVSPDENAAADESTESSASVLDDGNLSDDFVIGKDFFIDSSEADSIAIEEDEREKKKVSGKRRKKAGKSCLTSVIWMAAILVIAVAAAGFLLFLGMDYLGVSLSSDSTVHKEIVIDQGTSAKMVAEKLKDSGVIKSSLFFRLFAKKNGYDSKFQYGIYYFCKQDSYEDIAEALIKQGAHGDEVEVTIPEGWTVDQIAARLEENGVCKASEFKEAVNEADKTKYPFDFMDGVKHQSDGVHYTLEGYLYPDTYRFYATGGKKGAEQAIKKMLERFDELVTPELRARAEEIGMSLHDALTLSSVIELEAGVGSYADKQKVSAVFHNRLNDWGEQAYLQSDPTQKYPYNKSKYDTYKIVGLAPGAYCSPSIDSIKAALYPDEECKAYYFVTDKEMNFYYSLTYTEHQKTISRLKREGKWA